MQICLISAALRLFVAGQTITAPMALQYTEMPLFEIFLAELTMLTARICR